MNTKELRKGLDAALLKSQRYVEAALEEVDRVKAEVAELVGGEPEQFTNNVRAVRSKLRNYDELEAQAEKLGYTSAAKALDALSRTKPEKLVTLPDWALRQPARWTTSYGFSETKANSYLRAVHKELRHLLTVEPDYFETLPAENLAAWKASFNTDDHPVQFLAKVREERDEYLDPETYKAVEAKLAEETGEAVNPTRGELHRLLERHFKPLFGRESDWELVKAQDDERYYAAQQVATLEAALTAGGQQSLNEALAFLEPTLFALAGFSEVEYRGLQYDGELPQGAALLEQLRKELPTTREDWLTSERTELLTY